MSEHSQGATDVVVVGGPTASGKSGLALAIAEALGGTVINADSMQLYAELDIVTARPPADDLGRAPHRLYGVLPVAERGSAARWRDLALAEIVEAAAIGRLPIVVGGTGLYLRALMQGLSEVPPIPDAVRAAAHARLTAVGGTAFRDELVARDPDSAKLNPGDTTRLTRAWEVLEATGQPLSHWQSKTAQGGPPGLRFTILLLDPPRPDLYALCDRRFLMMMEQGALDEVRRLDQLVRERGLPADLPALKALGVPELRRHIDGDIALETAIALAQQSTRRYAKRQVTWFRHQLAERPPHTAPHGCHTIDSLCSLDQRSAILRLLKTNLNR